jgi:hypothetical protein
MYTSGMTREELIVQEVTRKIYKIFEEVLNKTLEDVRFNLKELDDK